MLQAKAASFLSSRTKWKRQTAVGLELLAEAGNYSALQRMFPSPYFYPQSLVSNLDPGAALYLYRGPSAPPPALQRPLVPRILLHGLQGGSEPPPPPPPLPPMSGVLSRPAQQRWAGPCRDGFFLFCTLTLAALDSLEETKQRQKTDDDVTTCSRPLRCEMTHLGWTEWTERRDWNSHCLKDVPFFLSFFVFVFLGHELYL